MQSVSLHVRLRYIHAAYLAGPLHSHNLTFLGGSTTECGIANPTQFYMQVYYFPVGATELLTHPKPFFLLGLCGLLTSFTSTLMFTAMGSFFNRISDPDMGGAYLTLLNTIANMGEPSPTLPNTIANIS